jgi:hypothetical protein
MFKFGMANVVFEFFVKVHCQILAKLKLYIFSKDAKKVWTGKLEVQNLPETSAGITPNMVQPMKILANSNRLLLEGMGMGEDIIRAVLKD